MTRHRLNVWLIHTVNIRRKTGPDMKKRGNFATSDFGLYRILEDVMSRPVKICRVPK